MDQDLGGGVSLLWRNCFAYLKSLSTFKVSLVSLPSVRGILFAQED